MKKISVGILGATGAVGQRFIQLLAQHPWFRVTVVAASERSHEKLYRNACKWVIPESGLPEEIGNLPVLSCVPHPQADLYFSALPSNIARDIELEFAAAGFPVISNAASHRMANDVPLLVPEVNPDHIELIRAQKTRFPKGGFIVTNPNCTVAGLVILLDALQQRFSLTKVLVTTLQALSGAGYPGVPSLDILDNVVPFIANEEEKVETEPRKILGSYTSDGITSADFIVSAHCNRVAVRDGHLETVSVAYENSPTIDEMKAAILAYRGRIQELELPSAPEFPLVICSENDRPQPAFDRNLGNGMTVSVGRIRPCPVLDHKCVILSHNAIRGAAGAAILNAELLMKKGYL